MRWLFITLVLSSFGMKTADAMDDEAKALVFVNLVGQWEGKWTPSVGSGGGDCILRVHSADPRTDKIAATLCFTGAGSFGEDWYVPRAYALKLYDDQQATMSNEFEGIFCFAGERGGVGFEFYCKMQSNFIQMKTVILPFQKLKNYQPGYSQQFQKYDMSEKLNINFIKP